MPCVAQHPEQAHKAIASQQVIRADDRFRCRDFIIAASASAERPHKALILHQAVDLLDGRISSRFQQGVDGLCHAQMFFCLVELDAKLSFLFIGQPRIDAAQYHHITSVILLAKRQDTVLTVHEVKSPITKADSERVKQIVVPLPDKTINRALLDWALITQAGRQLAGWKKAQRGGIAVLRLKQSLLLRLAQLRREVLFSVTQFDFVLSLYSYIID